MRRIIVAALIVSLWSSLATAAPGYVSVPDTNAVGETPVQSVTREFNKRLSGEKPITPNLVGGSTITGTVIGSVTDGSAGLSGLCINGVCPITAFGATAGFSIFAGAFSMLSGSAELISTGGFFQPSIVGNLIIVSGAGAGGAALQTTVVTYINNHDLILAAPNASGGDISSQSAEWCPDNTTAITSAITATGIGGSLYVPSASTPYCFTRVTIPKSIRVYGDAVSNQSWGAAFGLPAQSPSNFKGSTLVSMSLVGRAVDITGIATGASMANLAIVGPGYLPPTTSITSCAESVRIATCSATANGLAVGTPIYISGNSVAGYNGFIYVQTASTNSFTFNAQFSGLGTGTGGTIQPESVGLSIGDRIQNKYNSNYHLAQVLVGNFGTGVSVYTQNSQVESLRINGDFTDGLFSEGDSNAFVSHSLEISGNHHINLDWASANQSSVFEAVDLENPKQNDATAIEANFVDCNNCYLNGYIENTTNAFTGDGTVITGNSNANLFVIDSVHSSLGSAQISTIHVKAVADNTTIRNTLGNSLVVDAGTFHTMYKGLNNKIGTYTDNSGPTVASCGTGAPTADNSDDAFEITATGATSCQVIFNRAWSKQPTCSCNDETTAAGLKVVYGGTANGANITVSGLTSGDVFSCNCTGVTS